MNPYRIIERESSISGRYLGSFFVLAEEAEVVKTHTYTYLESRNILVDGGFVMGFDNDELCDVLDEREE